MEFVCLFVCLFIYIYSSIANRQITKHTGITVCECEQCRRWNLLTPSVKWLHNYMSIPVASLFVLKFSFVSSSVCIWYDGIRLSLLYVKRHLLNPLFSVLLWKMSLPFSGVCSCWAMQGSRTHTA